MTTVHEEPVGVLLRHWRERRGLSQLALANRAEVSARHVSFLETGRSRPTRTMLLRLADQLDIPLRERNSLLLAAGLAPAYPEHRLGDVPMAAVADAIERILASHRPYPALVVDRHWTMVDANDAVVGLLDGCAPRLLEPPVNVLRVTLHPEGMAPRIANHGQWRAHLLTRLRHQLAATGDPVLRRLHAELAAYPCDDDGHDAELDPAGAHALVVPLRLRTDDGELSLLSTTTLFGTPLDVTVAELAIEAFYPADETTRRLLGSR
ncbi:helix-turn-helix domain-containing protein [Rhodococcus aetherivorans]|uniref:helix-turn-helix domain-containing protein n=1 Tax=Rhodococcus TaxID=1827 RepID=UPI00092B9A97|nr:MULTISPECIES: helix-turn-helix transcriptional regulator [Rhodococcus]MDV6292589.1 helix-turn-helix transcriptional regulator [Rhodococcus aetherivorans]OLL18136.1 transcriptional regulator [Rhodococcus sp. M8]QPG45181.1 helix-turn-helix transcriptional regulator [Rhodococcus sp. M8]WFS13338.1 helix-turn-helix transcriptional regulator [Rhodococcus aetherivorans]